MPTNGWAPIGHVAAGVIPDPPAHLAADAAEVEELAVAVSLGAMTADAALDLLHAEPGGGRRLAVAERVFKPGHPSRPAVMALLDASVERSLSRSGGAVTDQGCWTAEMLQETGGKVVRRDGKTVVVLPVEWPWIVRPNREAGIPGVRGEPVYLEPGQGGPIDRTGGGGDPLPARQKQGWWT